METLKPRLGRLNDTLNLVARELEDRPEIPMDRLREIAAVVSGMVDPDAMRVRIHQLANAETS